MTTPLRLLVVGVGSIGERHVRCFLATGRVQVSVCDTNPVLLKRIAAQYPVDCCFDTLDEALRHAFDAVVIATPAHLHIPMADQAVRSGCHLLIEKPLSVDLAGIEALQSFVAEQQRLVMVAYVMRSHPLLAAMRTAIRSERFGAPLHLYATAGQYFPKYRPAYREIYYRDRSTGGGAIQDALVHVINAAEWIVGPVSQLIADATHQRLPGVDVEDTVNVLARHDGVLACYAYNQHQAPNELTMSVVCERGTARFESHCSRWSWMSEPDSPWQHESLPPLERDTIFIRQANHFLDAMIGRQTPTCTLEEAVRTLGVTLAVLKASQDRSGWLQPFGLPEQETRPPQ